MTRKNHLLKIKEICNTPILYDFRPEKMVFLTNESANKAEINILSARDTTRPGP